MRKIFFVLALLTAATFCKAGSLYFAQTINVEKLLGELKDSTGLHFYAVCNTTCPVHGFIYPSGGLTEIGVYESTTADVRVTSSTFSQELQDQITATVESHVP